MKIYENVLKYNRNQRKSWNSMKTYQNKIEITENHENLWKYIEIL